MKIKLKKLKAVVRVGSRRLKPIVKKIKNKSIKAYKRSVKVHNSLKRKKGYKKIIKGYARIKDSRPIETLKPHKKLIVLTVIGLGGIVIPIYLYKKWRNRFKPNLFTGEARLQLEGGEYFDGNWWEKLEGMAQKGRARDTNRGTG